WFSVVKWLGVAYLAYLGVRMLRSTGTLELPGGEASTEPPSRGTIFLRSFLVAATNPKGYLFFSAFLPQFIVSSAPQIPQYVALAVIFASLDCLVMLAYAMLGSRAVRLLKTSGTLWLERLCGAALLALAGFLAFYRRASA